MTDPITFVVGSGVLTNFVYDSLKAAASSMFKTIAPGAFRGSVQLLKEVDREFDDIKEKTLKEYPGAKSLEIFLSPEKTIRGGVLNPLFKYLFLGAPLNRQALISNLKSCKADGEELSRSDNEMIDFIIDKCKSTYLANSRTAPFVIHSAVKEIKNAFLSIEEINQRLTDQFSAFDRSANDDVDRFCFDYLHSTKEYVREIIINGLDAVTKKERVRHKIDDAFVPLTIDHAVSYQTTTDGGVAFETSWRGNALDIIKSVPRIIIRGPAGSGKTTLLQWFISSCNPFGAEDGAKKLDVFPIYIPLRRLEGLHIDDWGVKNIVYMTLGNEELRRRFPTDLFDRLKQKNVRYTFLLDGVDEIADHNRDRFWKFVENILQLDPTVRVVITSRNLSIVHLSSGEYRDDIYQSSETYRAAALQWRPPRSFIEFVVLPLTNEEIVEFIDRWHIGLDETLLPISDRKEVVTFPKKLKAELFAPEKSIRCGIVANTNPLCAYMHDVFSSRWQAPT